MIFRGYCRIPYTNHFAGQRPIDRTTLLRTGKGERRMKFDPLENTRGKADSNANEGIPRTSSRKAEIIVRSSRKRWRGIPA